MHGRLSWSAIVLALVLGSPVWAAQAGGGLGEAAARFAQERKRLVEQNLTLTRAEAARFWPLYERMQKDLAVLIEKRRGTGDNHGCTGFLFQMPDPGDTIHLRSHSQ